MSGKCVSGEVSVSGKCVSGEVSDVYVSRKCVSVVCVCVCGGKEWYIKDPLCSSSTSCYQHSFVLTWLSCPPLHGTLLSPGSQPRRQVLW